MSVVLYRRAANFLRATRTFLDEQPVTNQLTLANALRLSTLGPQEGVIMAAVCREKRPILVAMMTPPHWLTLSHANGGKLDARPAAESLAKRLAGYPLPGVIGVPDLAEVFSSEYCGRRGYQFTLKSRMGVFQLLNVTPPPKPPGALRKATRDDQTTLVKWREAFLIAVNSAYAPDDIVETVQRGIVAGTYYVWEDRGPVSMAVTVRPLERGISIGGVYTPPEYRRRGYASACVAALSQSLLDSGYSYCSLFTDLANPTSNHIYHAMGYEPAGEVVQIEFSESN